MARKTKIKDKIEKSFPDSKFPLKKKKSDPVEGTRADKSEDVNAMKARTYKGKSMMLGGGGRFQKMVDSGMSPALVASIGRKKLGAKKMASLANAGRKRSSKKK